MARRGIRNAGFALACLIALAGCAAGPDDQGTLLGNLFSYGGPTVPPSAPPPREEVACPRPEVIQGAAATRSYAGAPGANSALRHQIGVVDLARECEPGPGDTNVIRVGVRGRVLIGPSGAPGRFEAPVRFVVRTPSQVFETRVRRVPVTVPAGQTQADFTLVEEGFTVPRSVGSNFLIEVGIGG